MRKQGKWLEGHDTKIASVSKSFSVNCFEVKPRCSENLPSTSLLDHLLCGGGVAIVYSENVDFKHPFQILLGEIEESFYLCNTGVGDHSVKRSEFVDGCLDEDLNVGETGYICCHSDGVTASTFDG